MPKASEATLRQRAMLVLSWFGAMACAWAAWTCATITVLGGMATMDEGGFVASGGPYAIEHPVPQGFWLLPVAFVGMFLFVPLHAIFASRIKGFGIIFATWCALWTAVGATTLWYGFNPPGSEGLAWGWLVMGGIFLLVGLASSAVYVMTLRVPAAERAEVPRTQRALYLVLTIVALGGGIATAFPIFASVIG